MEDVFLKTYGKNAQIVRYRERPKSLSAGGNEVEITRKIVDFNLFHKAMEVSQDLISISIKWVKRRTEGNKLWH